MLKMTDELVYRFHQKVAASVPAFQIWKRSLRQHCIEIPKVSEQKFNVDELLFLDFDDQKTLILSRRYFAINALAPVCNLTLLLFSTSLATRKCLVVELCVCESDGAVIL